MGSVEDSAPQAVQTSLAFRLDPSLGGVDDIQVGKHQDLKKDWHDIMIHDISGREEKFKIDEAGFQFVRHRTSTKDFQHEEHVTTQYYDETARLARDVTGATFAHCYQHILRSSSAGFKENVNMVGVARGLHVDYSYSGAPEYIHTLPERPLDWERLSEHRWAIFSVWRPMNKVTKDALCIGDKRTIPDNDLVEGSTDMSAPGRKQKLGLFWVNYNPEQKYYYKKGMDADDVLLIKLYDSKLDCARCTPHSAFSTAEDFGDARTSIETRCIVVWEGESKS